MKKNEANTNFRHNVKFLCKQKGILLTELEQKVGCSLGYFSRPNSNVTISIAYAVSKEIGVSLDKMCGEDLSLRSREKEIIEKIKRLEIELAGIRVLKTPPTGM